MVETEVQKFYNAATVFLTGGSGFVGKILIEKLLRCTNVKMIYILIRDKKGQKSESRIKDLLQDKVFDVLKNKNPNFANKIQGIHGDCSLPGLDLSPDNKATLISEANIVFHIAANVKFNENLKTAYGINVTGTKEVLCLSKEIKNLKCMMHVSTAYVHCYLKDIDEKFYDHPQDFDEVGTYLNGLSLKEAEEVTSGLIGKWPNTYTYTKALSESLIQKTSDNLPIGIFRPSIVTATVEEPIPGWIDNLYGPTGVVAGYMSGMVRVLNMEGDMVSDIVPVDTCVAGLITSAWDVAVNISQKSPENISIYNFVSSAENPITWDEYGNICHVHMVKYPCIKTFWNPDLVNIRNNILYKLYRIILHLCPAAIMDTIAIITCNTPKYLKMYKIIHKHLDDTSLFRCTEWTFHNDNIQNLYQKLSSEDKKLFPLSIKKINWYTYLHTYVKGVRRYLLNDPDETLPEALIRIKRLIWMDVILRKVAQGVLLIFIWSIVLKLY